MIHPRDIITAVVLLCGACTSPTEPEPRPNPIVNEILVVGISDNGQWPEWGLYAIDLDSLDSRLVTPSPLPAHLALSPDGRSILFSAWLIQEDRGNQLYVMDSDGENVRRVTGPPTLPLAGLDFWPSWAPDGNMIAFVRDFSLMVAKPDGSQQRVLVDSITRPGRPSWSPDGQRLLYAGAGVGGRDDLFAIDITTGVITPLTRTPDEEMLPDWAPHPDLVAFVGVDTSSSSWQVFSLTLSTGERRQLTHVNGVPRFPKWSRSARQIAFNITTGPNYAGEVYTVDSAGGPARLLAKDVRTQGPIAWGIEVQ